MTPWWPCWLRNQRLSDYESPVSNYWAKGPWVCTTILINYAQTWWSHDVNNRFWRSSFILARQPQRHHKPSWHWFICKVDIAVNKQKVNWNCPAAQMTNIWGILSRLMRSEQKFNWRSITGASMLFHPRSSSRIFNPKQSSQFRKEGVLFMFAASITSQKTRAYGFFFFFSVQLSRYLSVITNN